MSNYSIRTAAIQSGKFLKLIGFGTFSLIDDKIRVTTFDVACLTFNLAVAFLVFYLSLWYGTQRLSEKSILLSIGIIITMNGSSMVIIASIISVFCNRYRIWELINLLEDVMEKFQKVHARPNFTRYVIMFAAFAIISAMLIVIGLLVMIQWLGYSAKIGLLITYGYLSATFATSMGWTAMFYVGIYLRLQLVNDTIR